MQISQHRKTPEHEVLLTSPGGTARSEEGIASSGVTFRLWRLYQHAWLVCLLFPLAQVVREPISPSQVTVRWLALIGFASVYTWLMWPHPASQKTRARARSQSSFLLFGVLGILVLVFSLAYGPAWLWLFIGVSAIAGLLLPMRSAFAAIVLLTLLPLLLTLKMYGGLAAVDVWWLIALMLLVRGLGLDMIGIARMGKAIRELHAARSELARLRVEEERLRLARDLHDLLGQTLSMITLKSELARHLIAEDAEGCAQELTEIERWHARRCVRCAKPCPDTGNLGLRANWRGHANSWKQRESTTRSNRTPSPFLLRRPPFLPGQCARGSPTSSGTVARDTARSHSSRETEQLVPK